MYWYEHKLHISGGMTSIVPSSRRPSPLAEASRTPPAPGRALREALETAANAKKKTHIARHIASQVISDNADIFVYKNVQNTCLCFICYDVIE